jgi:hypothetical protein
MLTVMTPICNLDEQREQRGRQAGKLHLINAEVGTAHFSDHATHQESDNGSQF